VAEQDNQNWGHYLAYGLQMAVGVVLGYFAGRWFDRRFHAEPWGVLAGTLLASRPGCNLLIKDAIRINKD